MVSILYDKFYLDIDIQIEHLYLATYFEFEFVIPNWL